MLVKFVATDGIVRAPLWIEADLVRVVSTTTEAMPRTVIYQQDSDTPLFVEEEIKEVVKAINEGKTNAGASQP